MQAVSKQLMEYNYQAKYYNGISVISVSDIAHFTGVGRHVLHYRLKHNKSFVLNRDYYLLTGPELTKIFGKPGNAVEFKRLESSKPKLKESDFNLLNSKTAYIALI